MYASKNLALAFVGAAFVAWSAQADARPAKRHSAQAKIETQAGPSDIDFGRRVPAAAAVQATAAATGKKSSRRTRRATAAVAQATTTTPSFGGNDLVAEARRYLGGNPTGRNNLWCGAFMDMVLKHTGHKGGGNLARAYASYGHRVSGPQVGAIAVMARGGGGHVGVVSGVDSSGNPIIISGNHNDKVAEAVYPRGRIIAYVMPN
jgi:uncharacterized protein (TIGR02594 family)